MISNVQNLDRVSELGTLQIFGGKTKKLVMNHSPMSINEQSRKKGGAFEGQMRKLITKLRFFFLHKMSLGDETPGEREGQKSSPPPGKSHASPLDPLMM